MSDAIRDLLRELEEFGERNDREHGDRSRRMLNLTREADKAKIMEMILIPPAMPR